MTRMAGGQKTVISWQDAPDDLFFRATAAAKKVVMSLIISRFLNLISILIQSRKQLTVVAVRRCARRPFRRIL